MRVGLLRLDHRVVRDNRVTTHVLLTARALGCDFGVLSGDRDDSILQSVRRVVERWGDSFEIGYERSWRRVIKDWTGKSVHLTMYGLPIQEKIDEIRACGQDLLLIVGSEKVSWEVYRLVDWNIAVTNQPHSEVAALAVFLHMLFRGDELERSFKKAKVKVVPQERGKKVLEV